MKYPDLFKSRYPDLKGKAWIKAIDPEDRKVFVDIGLQEMDHGRKGGLALVKKHGRKHMKKNAKIGAVATNILREWRKQVQEYYDELSASQ